MSEFPLYDKMFLGLIQKNLKSDMGLRCMITLV